MRPAASVMISWRRHGAPEPGHAVRRPRRRRGARPPDGQSRAAPRRRSADRPLRAGPALDRLPHELPRAAAHGDEPRLYTELFFLDEAVALAAGHRPCAECRRDDYVRFQAAWAGPCRTTPRQTRWISCFTRTGWTVRGQNGRIARSSARCPRAHTSRSTARVARVERRAARLDGGRVHRAPRRRAVGDVTVHHAAVHRRCDPRRVSSARCHPSADRAAESSGPAARRSRGVLGCTRDPRETAKPVESYHVPL